MGATKQSLGIFSLILLFFAFAAYALTQQFGLFVAGNLVFGVFALVSYLASAREGFGTFLGERSTRYGANAALYSLLFIGIVVIANFLAARHYKRFDVTQERVFSLAPQSVAVLKGLDKELSIMAFVEAGKDEALEDLLKSYGDQTDKVKWEMVDPDKSPDLAQKYSITNYNTVRLAYADNSTLITKLDEEALTNGILRVTEATKKTACVVEGHGEPGLDDEESPRGYAQLKSAFEAENYAVQAVLLATQEKVPADCNLLVVPASPKPWLDPEMERLKTYLESGGRALFLLAAQKGDAFQPLLADYGVELGQNVVVDQVVRLFQGPALGLDPIVSAYGAHPITEGFTQRTIFPLTREVEVAKKEGAESVSIAKSSAQSWAETDLDELFQKGKASLDPSADKKGPISIAVAAKKKVKDADGKDVESRIVVFGSQEWVNNKFLGNFFNRDLALNALNWGAGEDKQIAPIRARSVRSSRVQLTNDQVLTIFYLSVLIIPELLLLAGIAAWSRRRTA